MVLKEIAKRLKNCTREYNTVARVGGDEFLIMLNSVKEVADVAIVAERIMEEMSARFIIQGHSLSVGCSIGVSMFPEHGADGETLIKNADAAMYSAKQDGRRSIRFFTDEIYDWRSKKKSSSCCINRRWRLRVEGSPGLKR
jgi:diguanylate cyclase (GGDEF)-like protein